MQNTFMSKYEVFSPETIDSNEGKGLSGLNRVIFNRDSKMISISPKAARNFENYNSNDRFLFVYCKEENTAYICPDVNGFLFKKTKYRKGLFLYNKFLIHSILGAHEPVDVIMNNTVRFNVGKVAELEGYEYAFPMILVR